MRMRVLPEFSFIMLETNFTLTFPLSLSSISSIKFNISKKGKSSLEFIFKNNGRLSSAAPAVSVSRGNNDRGDDFSDVSGTFILI